jgi:hypothetical protein
VDHPDFAFDDDQVSHGARLWANVLGLMSTNAWLEQNNRRIIELPSGERVIEATPDDYETAYRIFIEVCERTVINISDTHRKILDALHELHDESPVRNGFTTREIAKKAGCSPQTVSNNKTFLATSAKLIRETEDGISLLPGTDPEEWTSGNLTKGLPSPEKVRSWWGQQNPPPSPDGQKTSGQAGQRTVTVAKADTYAENSVQRETGQGLDTSNPAKGIEPEENGHVQLLSNEPLNSENGISKPNMGREEGVSSASSDSAPDSSANRRRLTTAEVERVKHLIREGMAEHIARAEVLGYVEEELEL